MRDDENGKSKMTDGFEDQWQEKGDYFRKAILVEDWGVHVHVHYLEIGAICIVYILDDFVSSSCHDLEEPTVTEHFEILEVLQGIFVLSLWQAILW